MKPNKVKIYNWIIFGLSLLFFFIYSFLVWKAWLPQWLANGHLVFNWPDANANYFFSNLFASLNIFFWPENFNAISDNLIHTRSINVWAGALVPITFLTPLTIFGLVAKVLGQIGVLFLTPALASVCVYLFYRIVYRVFADIDIAFSSALLLAALAPWLYFANIVMLPTVLFIFLILAGFHSFISSLRARASLWWWMLSVLLLTAAILVRPNEIIWLSSLILFVLYLNRKSIDRRKIFLGLLLVIDMVWLWLHLNKVTYGSYTSFGYLNLQTGTLPTEFNSYNLTFGGVLKLLVAPFGFDLALIVKNFWRYFIELNIYHFTFALAGLVLLLIKCSRRKLSRAWHKYLLILPFIFLIILVYYASWDIADPIVKDLNSISISYVRYFMPLYIFIIPLVAMALKQLFWRRHHLNKFAYFLVIAAIMLASIKVAFISPNDGLFDTKKVLISYNQQWQAVRAFAPADSVIITKRHDKIFFPYYRVVVDQGDLPLWSRVEPLLDDLEVYYYSDASAEQILVDQQEANQVNLDIVEARVILDNYKLYKVIKR